MRRLQWIVAFGLLFAPLPLWGQSEQPTKLSESLAREGLPKLAAAARERGNPIRGAILFSEKKLRCVECHARGASDRLGPDLTRLESEVSNEQIVESVLLPSARLREGFETESVLLDDGKVVSGRVVSELADALLLRSDSDPTRVTRVGTQQIVARKRNEKSAMPEGLVDLLSSRQDFLDLVSYLFEIVGTAPSSESRPANWMRSTGLADAQSLDQRIRGLALIDAYRCTSCHGSDETFRTSRNGMSQQTAPRLVEVTARTDPDYLKRFLADPLHVKPGTFMPDVMGAMTETERDEAASAIVVYLGSLTRETFDRQPIDREAAERGRELFHSVGCVACHAPRDSQGKQVVLDDSVALGNLHEKYSVRSLSNFLEDPLHVRPSGRMPDLALTHWEAVDLANYLISSAATESTSSENSRQTGDGPASDTAPIASPEAASSQVASGKAWFHQLGCVRCHQPEDAESTAKLVPLAELDVARGCLSEEPGAWPRFDFDTSQREAMKVAIEAMSDPLSQSQQIEWAMQSLRCYQCHQRDGIGGVSESREQYFLTTNENLGPQGRIPPPLTGVGGKLQPKWLRQVLVGGRRIRPYVKTRMPQYGIDNMARLLEWLPQVDAVPEMSMPVLPESKEMRTIATELVGSGGLNCIACHTFQQKGTQAMPAVDLTEMAERLHPQWFYQYMLSPQLVSPNTVMPSFWPGGRAIRKDILDGKTDQQIAAIWQYLQDGRQAPVPRGLHLEPIELLASEDRAVMLRRSYPGIGKRGIGVGYPSGANLAYDAEQMRIGMIWKGKFADPGGVWRGQGHGNVRPLGSDLLRFAPGPELDLAESPWLVDEGRPPDRQFTGYWLDSMGRPTFTYRFRDVEVEDDLTDALESDASQARSLEAGSLQAGANQVTLNRTVTFRAKHSVGNLWFRVATGDRISKDGDRLFRVADQLRVVIDNEHVAQVIDRDSVKWLVVPLEIPEGKSTLTLHYSW